MSYSKKGFELSANFIVMLILASLALTFGLVLIRMVGSRSNDLMNKSSPEFSNELISLSCDSSLPVCVAPNRLSRYPGKHATFSLQINNHFNTPKNFKVKVVTSDSRIGALKEQAVSVGAYGQEKVPVVVVPLYGAKKGTYDVNVNVTYYNGSAWKYYGSDLVYLIVK